MKLIYYIIPLSLLFSACDNPKTLNTRESASMSSPELTDMVGQKIDVLIRNFGPPDFAGPPSHYQQVFEGDVQPVVVFTYLALKARVFVTKDCSVMATSGIISLERDREERTKEAE